jgi:voltage-gated potassium channel
MLVNSPVVVTGRIPGIANSLPRPVEFLSQALAATILSTLTLAIECAGMAVLIHRVRAYFARGIKTQSLGHTAVLMIRVTSVAILLHLLQILLWAAFYRLQCLRSWEACFYFSATSYSTVGYGDIVLPPVWRLLGPLEAIMGVLMCGISVSVLFAIATRLIGNEAQLAADARS